MDKSNDKVECKLCNVFIQNHRFCIDQHVNGARHYGLYLEKLEICNNIVVYSDVVHCNLCDISVSQSESLSSVEDHIRGWKHEENMQNIRDLIEGEFLDLPDEITEHGSKVKCTICPCYIGFNYGNIDTHIQGKRHRLKRAVTLLPLNGIFSVENKSDELWCKICDEYFNNTIEDIFEHVENDDHDKILTDIENLIEDEDISIDNYLTVLSEDKATCNECRVKVPCNYHNLEEHINGYRHTS